MFDMRIFIQTIITLASSSLGFVAALAWNDAIRATLTLLLGTDDSVQALFIYAILATIRAVTVVVTLARIAARIGGQAQITREVD